MKKAIWAALAFTIGWGNNSLGAAARFEKVSDHCYCLQSKESGGNVAAVVTEEGILLVDPPEESGLLATLEALKHLTTKPVRWEVFTDYRFSHSAGARHFAQQGAILLASTQLRALSAPSPQFNAMNAPNPKSESIVGDADEMLSFPWFIFSRQLHLFPAGLEIRIFALQHKALTGGDVVVFVPAEKVIFVGSLFESASYPDIDVGSGGSALGWIEGLKQVIDDVPVLKPAIVQVKPEPKAEQEKTLEEGIVVVPAHGEISNLRIMKDFFDVSQKLRNEISRAIKGGSSCDDYLYSPTLDPYRIYGNFHSFASQLCEALSASKTETTSTKKSESGSK